MIKFDHVFIQYVKEFYCLHEFSCEISSHTLFVGDFFVGTNAIMRTLSKIDNHYLGNIFVDNVNLKSISDKDLSISYLPQKPVLFNKNIFKNLFYPLKIRKINKNIAKNLIYSTFDELKNNNFNIFNIKKNNNFNEILKIKIKKLNLSEQKIVTLIRTVLRKPKYVLLENFFEDLNNEHIEIAKFLLEKLKETSTIIACENQTNLAFENFNIINLTTEKKED